MRVFGVLLMVMCVFAGFLDAASVTRDELNHALICAGCEATVREIRKDLYKISKRRKSQDRVRKVMDRICPRFMNNYLIVTDENGHKTATTFEGSISGSIDMSPKISEDLVDICTYLTQDFEYEFIDAFSYVDEDVQDDLCKEVSKSCGEFYSESL